MAKNNKISSIYLTFLQSESALKRFLSRFLYTAEDIDDMAQETFLRAYRATSGRDIDSPKAYLFRVAKTMALKELSNKSKQLTNYLEEEPDCDIGTSNTLEEEILAQQKIRLFFDAIAELPPQCRRIFLMRKVQALHHKEIAEKLGISLSSVEKHIALGTLRCKKYVQQHEFGNEKNAPLPSINKPKKNRLRGHRYE